MLRRFFFLGFILSLVIPETAVSAKGCWSSLWDLPGRWRETRLEKRKQKQFTKIIRSFNQSYLREQNGDTRLFELKATALASGAAQREILTRPASRNFLFRLFTHARRAERKAEDEFIRLALARWIIDGDQARLDRELTPTEDNFVQGVIYFCTDPAMQAFNELFDHFSYGQAAYVSVYERLNLAVKQFDPNLFANEVFYDLWRAGRRKSQRPEIVSYQIALWLTRFASPEKSLAVRGDLPQIGFAIERGVQIWWDRERRSFPYRFNKYSKRAGILFLAGVFGLGALDIGHRVGYKSLPTVGDDIAWMQKQYWLGIKALSNRLNR